MDEHDDKTFDDNLSRLLRDGVEHPQPSPDRRAAMLDALKATQAQLHRPKESAMDQATPSPRWLPWALAAAAVLLIVAGWVALAPKPATPIAHGPEPPFRVVAPSGAGEPHRKTLDDGTIVIARPGAEYTITGERELTLETGDVYLIVAKATTPFVVETKHGTATAKGTRFAATTGNETRVYVSQGIVDIENDEGEAEIKSGQEGVLPPNPSDAPRRGPAPRISYIVSWAKEALKQVKPLVEKTPRDTGQLVAVDPRGQEVQLTLRRFDVDVVIEDGIARTTVDQTFFNHVPWNIEGTFTFPLPPGASVSRLAMYVNGTLMEGGMVERSRGQAIYTEIKLQRRDPALLEMMEGNVFKMRIFPIEGRQEKRIFLSYTQKLDELYGTLRYWFPMDHTHSNARKLSLRVRAKNAIGRYTAHSSTHKLSAVEEDGDLVLAYNAEDVKPDQDLLVHLVPTAKAGRASVTTFSQDGYRYVFARLTPKLPGEITPQPRSWIVLNDVSASRTKLDIKAQAHILERLMVEADDFDTVALVNLNVKAKVVGQPFVLVRDPKAEGLVKEAVVGLPIGGTNLSSGLETARWLIEQHKAPNPHILYLGDGVATDGKTTIDSLLKRVPKGAVFVGVGVGKKADANALQTLADDTGGLFALINPDEDIDWRVFDLVSALNTPRLLGLTAEFQTASGKAADIIAYPSARALADGETLFVVGRTGGDLPKSLVLKGTAGGDPFERRYAMADAGDDGSYIPRLWAKRHIDELLKSGDEHKDEIVRLSKQYYVMTPYASLIVLENEAMYKEFKVERGRKDHWALYPAPKQIPVVKEPLERQYWSWWGWEPEDEKIKASGEPQTVKDIVESVQFRINAPFYYWPPRQEGYGRFALYRLLGSKGDPTGLLTALLRAGAHGADGAAGEGPEAEPHGTPGAKAPVTASTPMPTLSLVSESLVQGEFLEPLGQCYHVMAGTELDRKWSFTRFYYRPNLATSLEVADGDYFNDVQFGKHWFAPEGELAISGKLSGGYLGLGAELALRLGDEDGRSLRGLASWGYRSTEAWSDRDAASIILEDDQLALPSLVVRDPSPVSWQAVLGTGLHEVNGNGLARLDLSVPQYVSAGLGQALTERFGRIRGDIRRHNAVFGHGGDWGWRSWHDGGIDLTASYRARLHGALEGVVGKTPPARNEPAPLKLDLPLPMFVGTPKKLVLTPHMERPSTRPRPPFVAPAGTRLLSRGQPVTASDDAPIVGDLEMVTDGDKAGRDGSYVELGPGRQWVQIDLGKRYELHAVAVWHYHGEARFYHDVVVQAGNDPDFVADASTLLNSDYDNSSGLGVGQDKEYMETYEGRLIDAKGVVARYVRLYSRGNTSNGLNHYTEVEVYGKESDELVGQAVHAALLDAIREAPGTTTVLAADFLVARKQELLGRTRTGAEDGELKAITAALEGIEQAYPKLEPSGIFWTHQGWHHRPQPWAFQPPQVQALAHYNWSFDLTRYATGLYSTTADVAEAVAERFATEPAGTVHDAAARRIAAAREAIRPVRVLLAKDGPAVLIGPGDRLDFTHTTSMYLEERVVCDGEQILHLYGELGLAARRKATPTRRAALRRLTPHLIEPADWLRRQYDVELAGEQPDRFTLQLTPFALDAKGEKKTFDLRLLTTVLADGRIAEKTLVVKGEPRLKLAFAYDDGTVALRWLGPDGKELRKADYKAEPLAPDAHAFKADLAPFAVFDMPLRKPSYYQAKIGKLGDGAAKTPEGARLKRHLALALTQELQWRRWGGSNPEAYKAATAALDALAAAGLRGTLGDLTLIGSCGQGHQVEGLRDRTDAPASHPVTVYFKHHRRNDAAMAGLRDAHPGTLVGHLAAYHAAIQDRKANAALDAFLTAYDRSPLLFAAVFYHSDWGSKPQGFAKLFGHPRWRALAILTAAQRAQSAEQKQTIAAAFAQLHAELTPKGVEVPVTAQVAALLRQTDGGQHWQTVVRAALKVATDTEQPAPLLRFAELALLNGEKQLAEVAIAQASKLAAAPDSLLAKLTIAQTWWAGGQPKEALRLYDEILADLQARKLPPSAVMLAAAARLAEQAGDHARAIDLEEQALAIEHRHLPELINLQAFHQRYRWLWSQYVAKVTEAAKAGDDAAVTDWAARAEETWTRWYEVDPSITTVHLMADLQHAAGNADAVWLYLSSIIDAKPKEAQNHFEVGQWYEREGRDLDAAQQWYANAAQWDTANPRYLFERARVLGSLKRTDESKKLLRQIADGKWAGGHQGWVTRAKKELQK